MFLADIFSPSRVKISLLSEYITIRRTVLDELLKNHAVERGAFFYQAHVGKIETEPGGHTRLIIDKTDKPIKARYYIIATGSNFAFLKNSGITSRSFPTAIGARRYVRSDYKIDRLIFAHEKTTPRGYGWIFPLGDGEYNMGVGYFRGGGIEHAKDMKKIFRDFKAGFPQASRLLEKGEILTPLCASLIQFGLRGTRPLAGANILLTGEALGATLPFTGEGIAPALLSGEIAARVVHQALRDNDPDFVKQYPGIIKQEMLPRYRGLRLAEIFLKGAPFDLFWKAVQKSKVLHQLVHGITLGSLHPSDDSYYSDS